MKGSHSVFGFGFRDWNLVIFFVPLSLIRRTRRISVSAAGA